MDLRSVDASFHEGREAALPCQCSTEFITDVARAAPGFRMTQESALDYVSRASMGIYSRVPHILPIKC